MKLRIDGRFIALQALGCIACYALGVLIVFAICNVNDPVGFIGASFIAAKASGRGSWECANTTPTLYAGYPHIHLWGNPEFARSFIKQCAAYAAK